MEVLKEKILPVEGKLEYINGKAEVIELEKGSLVEPKSRHVSVAVWIGGGYKLWIWDGTKWTCLKDKRAELKGKFHKVIKRLMGGVNNV